MLRDVKHDHADCQAGYQKDVSAISKENLKFPMYVEVMLKMD